MHHGQPPPATAAPRIGPIVDVTVVVADLAAAVARYRDGFGWTVTTPDPTTPAYLAADPGTAATALLAPPPPAGAPGAVRLVQRPGAVPAAPLRRYGWTAIELCVRDVHAAVGRAVASGWTLLRAPDRLASGRLPLVAAQIAGADGEAVYLTQRLGEVSGFDLPLPRQDVDGVFIAVLGARDLEATRTVLEHRFRVRRASDRRAPIGVLNLAYGLPDGTAHWISTLQLDGRSCIEIDQLPPAAGPAGAGIHEPGGATAGVVGVAVAAGPEVPPEVVVLPDDTLLELRPENPEPTRVSQVATGHLR